MEVMKKTLFGQWYKFNPYFDNIKQKFEELHQLILKLQFLDLDKITMCSRRFKVERVNVPAENHGDEMKHEGGGSVTPFFERSGTP